MGPVTRPASHFIPGRVGLRVAQGGMERTAVRLADSPMARLSLPSFGRIWGVGGRRGMNGARCDVAPRPDESHGPVTSERSTRWLGAEGVSARQGHRPQLGASSLPESQLFHVKQAEAVLRALAGAE